MRLNLLKTKALWAFANIVDCYLRSECWRLENDEDEKNIGNDDEEGKNQDNHIVWCEIVTLPVLHVGVIVTAVSYVQKDSSCSTDIAKHDIWKKKMY